MPDIKKQRLLSLDLFRGLTMFLLVAEGANLYEALIFSVQPGSFFYELVKQFHHHKWNGLHFWDLVQPCFMFIVGVAMTFSINKRIDNGASWAEVYTHMFLRCMVLFFLGLILHCGYNGKLVWELWNVLTQLSFTIMGALLVFRAPVSTQLAISFSLLLLTDLLYRFAAVPGFDQPFTIDHNFGSWMDTVLMGKINTDGWVAINCVPTTAHTIWGALAGRVLMEESDEGRKLKIIGSAGLAGIFVGHGLDISTFIPIIKRICTSSFVIASGGWCMLTLAFFYWLVDIRGHKKWINFFIIVGMNPIFIYMFSETAGKQWMNGFTGIFTLGFLGWFGVSESAGNIISAFTVLGFEWYICFWLYKRSIFFKI